MSKESPLFNPVIFKGRSKGNRTGEHIAVLDETKLPFDIQYIKVKNLKDALYVLREMKTRAFGQVLLFYYTLVIEAKNKKVKTKKDFLRIIDLVTDKFIAARPTFAFGQLKNDLIKMLVHIDDADFLKSAQAAILNYIQSIQNLRRYRAKLAANILPHNARILTHCNISGELVEMANAAEKLGKSVEFFVTETRPYFQGSRLTAWELNHAGYNVYLFSDIQAADILKNCRIDMVLTGSDRVTRNGDIANKTGTYQLAVLAKHLRIPFYCFTQPPGETKGINDIKIEYRPKEEMLAFGSRRLAPKSQDAIYPAFDVVPAELITGLVFFDGIYTPQNFAKKWEK